VGPRASLDTEACYVIYKILTQYLLHIFKIKFLNDHKTSLQVKSKVKQSRYTPWRRLGGEEV
jgi:hypothetical protein